MTEEQLSLLEMVAEELKGELYILRCSDKNTQHQKIVIEYGHCKKQQ